MRKNTLFIIPIAFFLLLLGGCKGTEPPISSAAPGPNRISASELFGDLPADSLLTVSLDGEILWPETAAVYTAAGSSADLTERLRSLLPERTEKLTALTEAFPCNAMPYETVEWQLAGISRADYGTGDLSFLPMEDAAKAMEATLTELGLSGFRRVKAYALDAETITANLEKSLRPELEDPDLPEEARAQLNEMLALEYGPEDECYFFVWQLTRDELPLLTATATQTQREVSGAEIYGLYGPDGIIYLHLTRVPTSLVPQGAAQQVSSPKQAAETALPRILALEKPQQLLSAELCYAYYNTDTNTLTPTWVFVTSSEKQDYSGETVTVYNYFAVNALTGEAVIYDMRP